MPRAKPEDTDLTVTGHAGVAVQQQQNAASRLSTTPEVFPAAKEAQTRFDRFLQPTIYACLKYGVLESVGGTRTIGGTGVTIQKVERLPFPKMADRSGAFRVTIGVQSGSRTVTVFSDFLYVGVGRTQIYVNVVAPSAHEQQLPAFELRLAKLLVKRAVHRARLLGWRLRAPLLRWMKTTLTRGVERGAEPNGNGHAIYPPAAVSAFGNPV